MTNDNLVTFLKMLHAGPSERKELAMRLPETKARAYQDGNVYEVDNLRAFVLSEDLEGSGLVQIAIHDTVMKGAIKAKCFREVIPVIRMSTDTMRVPYGNGEQIAPQVNEAAEFPAMYQDYNYATLTALKYGNQIPISQELIDDSKFDIVAIELEKAGRNLESTLNQLCLNEFLDGADNEHDTAGTNQGIIAIVNAKKEIESDGFYPDKVVLHPQAFGKVFVDYKPGYNPAAEDTLRSGILPQIAGMTPYQCSVADSTTSYIWEYDTDADIGMLAFDSANAGFIGMRQDVTVKMHEQPLKMIQSPVVFARWDVVHTNGNATCRVEY